jgi:hypothetical protein
MYRCVVGYCGQDGYLPFSSREGVGIRHPAARTLSAAMAWCLVTETVLNVDRSNPEGTHGYSLSLLYTRLFI